MGEARRRRQNSDWQFCAYCGEPRTSRDHVPPRSLFTGTGHQHITVPACDKHNGERSGLDERFRDLIAFQVAEADPDHAIEELVQRSIRGIQQNKPRLMQIARTTQWLPKIDRYAIPFPNRDLVNGIDRIVRGLHWHHQRTILPPATKVRVGVIDIQKLRDRLEIYSALTLVGGISDQFLYRGGILSSHPDASAWVFAFHRRLIVVATTGDVEAIRKTREAPTEPA